ncbi:SDR family NAD(P)-dependent oxidoreductase [Arthrobacter sp. ISL-30]|uniref:SDR family NAD(P)-dependent oxidoreductase n=1 Tax=Arthrobacter sp. ISL-30 TaxID=2819109 RepID=UPI001BE7125A|nr:SDR family oxidoreductase [Arthrobacter sp. ISL-30]MBT2515687.1 SDR family oxidoreductase [Arthrobacter sp. ISL-30]
MQLEGKIALITGGGQGIGRGIVDRYLKEGAQLAIVQQRPLEPALEKHPSVLGILADMSVVSAASEVIGRTSEQFGGIDIVVNNAGIMFERSVSEIRPDEWDQMMALNLRAPLFLTQAAVPHLRQRGGGTIINIGSIEGLAANPNHAVYCASKAGIHGMTRAMAVDLGEDNIRCNAIAPGWIASELSENYLASRPDATGAREALDRLHPVGRVGRPADVGDLAVFLASDRSGFLTGEIIVLDGGRTARLPLPF